MGVDPSPTRIKRAKRRVIEGRFIVGDVYNPPFKSNTFDVVVLGEIIEHLHEPEKALLEINRILFKLKGNSKIANILNHR